ncbi:hypothetical protein PMI08_02036 [Brevibacillus sp. CF112]|nr:hypothetical protein [Brevibacillus agri]EJL44234.1 hypothetical protein PMI08_02036 [Brevibacillus sp. CF112]MBG9563956.1 hypothetical protein [Brevibacillus agri]MED3501196.1 hypothetical protein [Brevibacillus agri]QAV15390.1 hypothetical protein BA6348_23040 [Brevibacillus agri]RNB61314.1 hypothetical protein EB820_01400 [Brevibacillus agri]
MGISWDNINDVYSVPNFEVKKGTVVKIKVSVEGDLKEFERSPLGTRTILNNWSYHTDNGKEIKPFKLVNYLGSDSYFEAELMYVKKDKEKDELKLLCQDLMDVYNMEQISIKKWEAKTI